MPITIDPDASAGFVRVRYSVPFTFEEWFDVVEQLRTEPAVAFNRDVGLLIDRTAVGCPDGWFVKRAIDYVAAHRAFARGRRIAIVVRDRDAGESAWMQAMLFEDAGAVSSVFTSLYEAEAWLRQRSAVALKR